MKIKHLRHSATGRVATEQAWRKGYEDLLKSVEPHNDPKLMCMMWYGCGLRAKPHKHLDSDWASMLIEVEQDKDGKWVPVPANKST